MVILPSALKTVGLTTVLSKILSSHSHERARSLAQKTKVELEQWPAGIWLLYITRINSFSDHGKKQFYTLRIFSTKLNLLIWILHTLQENIQHLNLKKRRIP